MNEDNQLASAEHLPNRRVLIIDDNRAIHEDYRKILAGNRSNESFDKLSEALFDDQAPSASTFSFELTSAYQGREGLARVEQSLAEGLPFAMAFVDMRMPPGWDGLETILRIWAVDPCLQVVISSAYTDHTWSELVERLPQDDQWLMLRKPFDSAEVSQLALALTQKWELERQAREKMISLEQAVEARTMELIREVKKQEEIRAELSKQSASLQALLEISGQPVMMFDDDGKIEVANSSFYEFIGLTEKPSTELRVGDLIFQEDGSEFSTDRYLPIGAAIANAARQTSPVVAKTLTGESLQIKLDVREFDSFTGRSYAVSLHSTGSMPIPSGCIQ